MGNEVMCTCLNDPRNYKEEYIFGEGEFNYKKIVINIFIIIIIIILFDFQLLPKYKRYEKISEKDSNGEIKNNIKDSFNQENKDLHYFNGTVEVIIPGKKIN